MQNTSFQVRPSTMLIKARYALALMLTGVVLYYYWTAKKNKPYWLAGLVLPAGVAISAASRHVRTRFNTLELAGDRLKLEVGMASKTSRSVPLAKVQDVTVSQSLGQRMLGIGDVSVVTAGEGGSLTMPDVNDPKSVAEKILDKVAAANPNRTR